jgi:hypothetical protein
MRQILLSGRVPGLEKERAMEGEDGLARMLRLERRVPKVGPESSRLDAIRDQGSERPFRACEACEPRVPIRLGEGPGIISESGSETSLAIEPASLCRRARLG